jgi:hypothetical protein
MRMSLTRVPADFRLTVRRRDGSIAAGAAASERARTLDWQPIAGEEYGFFFEPVLGATPTGRHAIGIEVEAER